MRWIALSLLCFAVAGMAATAATARTAMHALISVTTGSTAPIATGIGDPIFQGPQAAPAYALAKQAGASYSRIFAHWRSIAPATLPASGFNQSDPKSPYYHWAALDANVAAANAAGVTPILNIASPPSWGYAVQPGSWTGGSPDITKLGAFATAIAKHYNNAHAPIAHVFSVWNEPNFNRNLYPQDPTYYRDMVNAVATSVHAVNPNNLLAAGELAPFKHKPGPGDKNSVIPPLAFMQTMLCVSGGSNPTRTCNTPAKFDVWTHHPYSDTGPFGHAKVKGGIELGDLPKMNSLLQSAQQLGAIQTQFAKPVQFWITEVGWSSNPPNKKGVPISLETRWVAETMYQVWKSGATLSTWFLLQDMAYPSTPFQSGLYTHTTSIATAQPKPLLQPFAFPFVAYLKKHGQVSIWGKVTTANVKNVKIQQRTGANGAWKDVAVVTSNNYGIFQATLGLKATNKNWLRASATGSGDSAAFALKVPKNENLHVTPFPLVH